jgi:hypothetical protein
LERIFALKSPQKERFPSVKVIKDRFEQAVKEKGIQLETSRYIAIGLESFDKLVKWAIDHCIYEKQMFYSRVSDWILKYKIPRISAKRKPAVPDKKYSDIEELLKDMRKTEDDRNRKVAILKISEEAYQILLRWAVEQGASTKEEMAELFEIAILRATLPGERPYKRKNKAQCECETGEAPPPDTVNPN